MGLTFMGQLLSLLAENWPRDRDLGQLFAKWPGHQHIPLGRADFHGRWINWAVS